VNKSLLSLGFAVALIGGAEALAAPSPSLVEPVARIDYGRSDGSATMVLKVDGLDASAMAKPDVLSNIKDLQVPTPPSVEVDVASRELQQARGAASRTWLLTIAVRGLPANTTQQRYFAFSVAGSDITLAYSLTNTAPGRFSWTIKSPANMTISPGEAIPIPVSTGPVPATGVTVLQTALTDKVNKRPISSKGLHLCRTAQACNGSDISLPPNTPVQLWLHGADRAGAFEGNVTIAAVEKPEGDTITLNVYSTSFCYQIGGVLAILVGIVLAWAVTIGVRNRINRDQLLLPAASLRATLLALEEALKSNKTGEPTTGTTGKLADTQAALSDAKLEEAGLPGRWSPPWNAPTAASVEAYRKYVQGQADWTAALQTIVLDGLEKAWAKWSAGLPDAEAQAVKDGVKKLDDLAAGAAAPTIDALRKQVQAILTELNGKLVTGAAGAPALGPAATAASPEQLRVEINRLGLVAWGFIALATALAGAYVLVFSTNALGFGNPVDYLVCLLWGFGLPIGSTLMQSTTASVSATFGVTR
jgi:hypothetical protein